MENLFIARQPIYDKQQAVIGYELLYRNSTINRAIFEDGNLASSDTIINSFMNIGIDTLVGSALAFINLPEDFLINQDLTPMFKEHCVFEILETVEVSDDLLESLRQLKTSGYQLALDDFVYSDDKIPLLELADFIKLEVNEASDEDLRQQIQLLKPYPGKLIAEKVENHELLKRCKALGFEYFQGFFFCHPQIIQQKHIPANKAVVLHLLEQVNRPDVDYDELEAILAQDVALTYKLLRYINSAAFSLRREIDSIKDAVVLLGIRNVKNWLSLILMSRVVQSKPAELIVTAMVRARMCELLAEDYHPEVRSQMFIIGLFSVLDALMDAPMIELLDTVILSTPIKMALLDQAGIQGEIYKLVLHYDLFEWDELADASIPAGKLAEAYLASIQWADQNIKSLLKQA